LPVANTEAQAQIALAEAGIARIKQKAKNCGSIAQARQLRVPTLVQIYRQPNRDSQSFVREQRASRGFIALDYFFPRELGRIRHKVVHQSLPTPPWLVLKVKLPPRSNAPMRILRVGLFPAGEN
jgi:hypothetical protein